MMSREIFKEVVKRSSHEKSSREVVNRSHQKKSPGTVFRGRCQDKLSRAVIRCQEQLSRSVINRILQVVNSEEEGVKSSREPVKRNFQEQSSVFNSL